MSASQHYQDKDPRCESLLESIRQMSTESTASPVSSSSSPKVKAKTGSGALPSAVADVVFAAGWMPRSVVQKDLIRAAIYGRTHAPQDIDAALIPLCVAHARVLNSLRKPSGVRSEAGCAAPPSSLAHHNPPAFTHASHGLTRAIMNRSSCRSSCLSSQERPGRMLNFGEQSCFYLCFQLHRAV
jgi:hypothetical protein